MDNPNDRLPGQHSTGNEGSNKIYIGQKCGWIDPYGGAYFSYEDMQEAVRGYTGGHGEDPLEKFVIDWVFRPRVPDICK